MGNRATHDALDARVLEGGDTFRRPFEGRGETVDVGRQQLGVEAPVDAVQAPGLRVLHLVGSDEEAVLLLSVVAGRARVAHHRRLAAEVPDLVEVLGHEVLVDHVHDGHLEPHPARNLGREGSGGIHHVLAPDAALVGHHLPFAAGQAAGIGDQGVAVDLGPSLTGARGHRVGRARGVGVAVLRGVGAETHAFHIHQGVELSDLVGTDEVALRSHVVEQSLHLAEPVHLVVVGREADRPAAVPAGGLTGLRLELLVEIGAVEMDLGHVEVADEMADQPRRVPGGARGELALLHQHRIGPALLHEVVEQSDAHRAAADDHHSGLRLHVFNLPRTLPRPSPSAHRRRRTA